MIWYRVRQSLRPADSGSSLQAAAYEALTEEMEPFTVGALKSERGQDFELRGRLLSLKGEWIDCAVSYMHGGRLWLTGCIVVGGMSGSPIITKDRVAIGVISNSVEGHPATSTLGPQPRLDLDFPGWLVARIISLAARAVTGN